MNKIRNKIIALSGQPVTGKGTTTKALIEKLEKDGYKAENIHVISTGNEFRRYFNILIDFIRNLNNDEKMKELSETEEMKDLMKSLERRVHLINTISKIRNSDIDLENFSIEQANNLDELKEIRSIIDTLIDEGIKRTGEEINSVNRPDEIWIVDSRLAFSNIPDAFSVRLTTTPEVAAKRLLNDSSRGKEDSSYKSLEEAKIAREKRRLGEQERYKQRYGIDLEVMKKSEIIKEGYVHSTVEGQSEILDKLKHVCDELGIKYSLDLKISKPNHMANDVLVDDILKYSDNKDILDSMNIVDRSSFYRKHFCEVSSPFYIDQTAGKKDIFYVTSLIHDAGGLCFLAHPFVYNLPNIKETLDEIVSLDIIDGIECAHRKHTEEQINFLIDYCNEHNLKKSGGSDFHIDSHFLGYANKGSYAIEKTLVNDWIKLVKNYYM